MNLLNQSSRWFWVMAGFVFWAAAGMVGCKTETAAPAAAPAAAAPAAPAKPKVRDGLTDDWRIRNAECREGRRIEAFRPGTPEGVLWRVFEAALAPDSAEGFATFYACLDPEKYREEWARDQFWGRLRTHVAKYVPDPKTPSFIVCREQKTSETVTKLFVFSHDPTKSHTPYGLRKVGEDWVIEFFTP